MPSSNYIPVEVQNISLFQVNFLVVLRHGSDDQVLPICIAHPEARAIATALKGQTPPRPQTHDLLKNLLDDLGCRVQKIHVTDLKAGTFYAVIFLEQDGQTFEVDSRPSDAIALAIRSGAPIFVREDVLRENSVSIHQEGMENLDADDDDDAKSAEKDEPKDPKSVLKRKLEKAIADERYEDAARYRDELEQLETGN